VAGESDAFSIRLLDEAKRFLEKASEAEDPAPFLHASLMLAFSALESHLNGLAEELALRQDVTVLDRAVLTERGLILKAGQWELSSDTRFYRLEDRVAFVFRRYNDADVSHFPWWSDLKQALTARNALVHPREAVSLSRSDLERYLTAIIEALNDVYVAAFSRGHPAYGRGLHSTLSF
jgi:hypothetical protein